MTLKARLAAMMIFLLIAVMALQYVLMQREQRELADRLESLTTKVNSSTRALSLRMMGGEGDHDWLSRVREELRREGGDLRHSRSVAAVQFEASIEDSSPRFGSKDSLVVSIEEFHDGGFRRRVEHVPGGRRVIETFVDTVRGEEDVQFWHTDVDTIITSHRTMDANFVLNIPLIGADSLHFVEIRYPTDDLTAAITESRKRNVIWLSSILGVGVLGAFLMAGQFTRPLRGLERSFRRVEGGDLAVSIEPKRDDEIGRLTSSFNHMVDRLREGRELETKLAETERLAAMGRLAAGVAHEVRNPLNAIQLNLTQLRDKVDELSDASVKSDVGRYHDTVRRELDRLERLVTAFLDLSHAEALETAPLDAAESLGASVELFRADAEEKGVRIEAKIPERIALVGDGARLTTVWHNLLSNAVAASDAGNVIEVVAEVRGDELIVTVTDEGSGIEAEHLPHIWDPFYTRRAGGTGLGLSIVRSVVEQHGGRVGVASEHGKGTAMIVRLPIRGESS